MQGTEEVVRLLAAALQNQAARTPLQLDSARGLKLPKEVAASPTRSLFFAAVWAAQDHYVRAENDNFDVREASAMVAKYYPDIRSFPVEKIQNKMNAFDIFKLAMTPWMADAGSLSSVFDKDMPDGTTLGLDSVRERFTVWVRAVDILHRCWELPNTKEASIALVRNAYWIKSKDFRKLEEQMTGTWADNKKILAKWAEGEEKQEQRKERDEQLKNNELSRRQGGSHASGGNWGHRQWRRRR